MKLISTILAITILSVGVKAQTGKIVGTVTSQNTALPFSTITIQKTQFGAVSDTMGKYSIGKIPSGTYSVVTSSVGYKKMEKIIVIKDGENTPVHFDLSPNMSSLDQVVVTGTRTPKRQTNSPVIVNLINSKTLDQVVASSLSEGLKYQPGLRVETDCQTCNYSQLRINGLQGGYSQILINSRQIFSPLMGLYGMEQIPTNMIDRIEVVRGGVSALYGSSAIGGTVNVITKIPNENSFNVTNTFQRIAGQTSDNMITGNVSMVNEARNVGVSVFVNNRNRGHYDANGDNFSELPELKDNTFGTNFYFKPAANQKLELSFSSINEYRFGGENIKKPAYLAQQSEERTHNIVMGSFDYSVSLNEDKNSLSIYYGGQKTDRKHYTGIIPDDSLKKQTFFADPPYGTSNVVTHQGGVQLNNKLNKFLGGNAVLTTGAEYVYDAVFDQIEAYDYKIDQTTKNIGAFVQQDWDVTPTLNVLAGFRVDKHNLVDHAIFSPRLSILYKLKERTQLRFGWGTGFRAPQAFDTDLHIAFAAGGVSRISLAAGLKEERSNSFTGSINYDKASEHFIAGYTIEGFYTNLQDAFFQYPLGADNFGKIFEKRNGKQATVKGITVEGRANFDYVVQIEAGFTVQSSKYSQPVENIKGLPAKKEFLRTPNNYGYTTITYTPTKTWNISANGVYTGSMLLAHFAGEGTGQLVDEYFTAKPFTDLGLRVSHTFKMEKMKTGLEIFTGMKNIFNSYQNNFDKGKNRDSNFIYGPNMPRTLFLGVRVKSL
jgi:outer membrane receptor for ferrienterochelin and colicins